MSDIGKSASRCATTRPGGRPKESLTVNQRQRLEDEPVPACSTGALPGLCGVLPNQSMALAQPPVDGKAKSGGRNKTAADLQLFGQPRHEGVVKVNLRRVAARRRDHDGWYGRNRRRRPTALGGGKARAEISHQPTALDIYRTPTGRGEEPVFSRVGMGILPRPAKKITGHSYAGPGRAAFFACILTVILQVGALAKRSLRLLFLEESKKTMVVRILEHRRYP